MDVLCSVDVAAVRAEPSDDSERVTELLRGEPVAVEGRRDGWARIKTAYDYFGWVREGELAGTEGDALEQARALSGHSLSLGRHDRTWHRLLRPRPYGLSLGRPTGIRETPDQQEAAGTPVANEELQPGDLITYGTDEEATHIAFWVGEGRILHSTEREGVDGVVEEAEPDYLRAQRRRQIRFERGSY